MTLPDLAVADPRSVPIPIANRAEVLAVAKLRTATIAYDELFVDANDDVLIARH